jgi:hypothetical protein
MYFKTSQKGPNVKNCIRLEMNPKPETKIKPYTKTNPNPIYNDPNHVLSIMLQNINGKYKAATKALDIFIIDDPNIQIIC